MWFVGGISFLVGLVGYVVARSLSHRAVLRAYNAEAKDILLQAKWKVDKSLEEHRVQQKTKAEKTRRVYEERRQDIEKKLAQLNKTLQPVRNRFEAQVSQQHELLHRRRSQVGHARAVLLKFKNKLQNFRALIGDQNKKYVQILSKTCGQDTQHVVDEWKKQLVVEAKQQAVLMARQMDLEAKQRAEQKAKQLCLSALQRFIRPSCNERGISPVAIKSKSTIRSLLAQDKKLLSVAAKSCGVDFHYDDEAQVFHIYGFDPVRRELGRMVLSKLARKRHLNERELEKTTDRCQKNLLAKIQADGASVAHELNVRALNMKIKNMMGALRYRYSFTQNQHFHCAEVGFLCGLLASELGLDVMEARRCGLLHDIGKAMDHNVEGGHAVIGADFIESCGESASVVHAVRAHHFDVQPESDIAFLVIAADALSGARPGARRSTAASYTQKVSDLENIASSFKGVMQTQILSAGREVRVMVDTKQVNDTDSLKLSEQIAQQIEEKVSFPGTIKVTVVRETQAVETALPRAS